MPMQASLIILKNNPLLLTSWCMEWPRHPPRSRHRGPGRRVRSPGCRWSSRPGWRCPRTRGARSWRRCPGRGARTGPGPRPGRPATPRTPPRRAGSEPGNENHISIFYYESYFYFLFFMRMIKTLIVAIFHVSLNYLSINNALFVGGRQWIVVILTTSCPKMLLSPPYLAVQC